MSADSTTQVVHRLYATVLACIVTTGLVGWLITRPVGESAERVAREVAPAIGHLSQLRVEVRHVAPAVAQWLDDGPGGRAEARRALDEALARGEAQLAAYEALRRSAGADEAELQPLRAANRQLEEAVWRAVAEGGAGLAGTARFTVATALREASHRLAVLSDEAIAARSSEARELGERIGEVRRRNFAVIAVLSAFWVSFAVYVLVRVRGSLARAEALQAAYAKVLETRAAELELFAGRVAHDIRSPLAAARLALDLAGRRGGDRVQEVVARGRGALSRADQIMEALLSFARAGARPDVHDAADVTTVVRGLMDELREEADRAGVQLALGPLPGLAVGARPGILASLVSNLVRNAVKHMGDAPRRVVTVSGRCEAGWVRFDVADTGLGVPASLAPRIFDPWVRGRDEDEVAGLGLGLATVKRLAEAHGGRVGLEPTPGGGATFWFELPAASVAPESVAVVRAAG